MSEKLEKLDDRNDKKLPFSVPMVGRKEKFMWRLAIFASQTYKFVSTYAFLFRFK